MAHSPVHGAMLIAGACKRPASTKTDKEFYYGEFPDHPKAQALGYLLI